MRTLSGVLQEMFPKLIPDAHIDVLVEVDSLVISGECVGPVGHKQKVVRHLIYIVALQGIKDGRNCNEHAIPPRWVPARLLALVGSCILQS